MLTSVSAVSVRVVLRGFARFHPDPRFVAAVRVCVCVRVGTASVWSLLLLVLLQWLIPFLSLFPSRSLVGFFFPSGVWKSTNSQAVGVPGV